MSSWNYRIVEEDDSLTIKEVHYKGDNPVGATEASFSFGSPREVMEDLLMQLGSLTRPNIVLDDDSETLEEGMTSFPEVVQGDINVSQIAEMAHNMNLFWATITGDGSKIPWSMLTEEERASCIINVKNLQEDPNLTPETIHNNWCDVKLNSGWVYGETLDRAAKTHPCLVSFGELDPIQIAKDEIWHSVVKNLLKYL